MSNTRFFFRIRVAEIATQLLVTFLLTMGLSSIVYFTIEFLSARYMERQVVIGVWINNLALALGLFGIAYLVYYVGGRMASSWLRYALLNTLTFGWSMAASFITAMLYWRNVNNIADYRPNHLDALYAIPPLVATNFLYYWLTRERTRTLKITEQEYELLKTNELRTKAELEALQAKINPHFLYNSLNSIASLVHEDPDKAEQMVLLLSKFFRYSTSVRNQYYDTVANELDIVQTYLDVERVRFTDRLHYDIDVPQELMNKRIPRFLLQPIVENAIKHGISKISTTGHIHIRIAEHAGVLVLSIHDNGPAFPEQLNAGYGLQSIQDKLRLLCGPEATIDLVNDPTKQIIIKMPSQSKELIPSQ
jgi:two-component system, LytTR family, sensor kinase